MSNRVVWLMALVFILLGAYTLMTFYSKINGRVQMKFFACVAHSLENKCIIQSAMNDFLVKILPDKNPELIKKFEPTPGE
jgi:hypothetical protein